MSEPSASGTSVDETETRALSSEAMPQGGITVGATASRYVVLEEIGRGGMGRVLRAYDPKLQREVALKEIHAHQLDAEATTRLVAEARAMAKLSHPNVVAVFDVEELERELPSKASGQSSRAKRAADRWRIDGRPEVILVMEYVPGQTLRAWLSEQDRPWQQVVAHFVAAGRGLVAAHEAGLLHRDFKPANVLVQSSPAKRGARAPEQSEGPIDGGSMDGDSVKVTDFGLAKADEIASSVSGGGEDSKDGMTEAGPELPSEASGQSSRAKRGADRSRIDGRIMGTPRYMAPEQHRGEVLTPAADQYAFCVALWEALCREPPFAGKAMADDKAMGPPAWDVHRSARSLRSGAQASTPRPIVDAILRGLSPSPGDRWPTMAALLEALSYDPAHRRNRWLLGLGAFGVLGLAGGSYQVWAGTQAQRCSGAEQQLVGIWDPTTKTEVEAAILGIGKSYAQDVWARTQRELDAYASDWATMHTEACEATTVRGEQSPQMMDLRMGCLYRATQELQATVEILADADDEVVHNAHELTGGLRPLSRCTDTEALAAEVEPPLPADAVSVEAARLELARAKSLARAGRYQAAMAAMAVAKDALAEVEYGPAWTEVALQEAGVLERLGQYEASEAALREALTLGSRWKQWNALASAATQLMFVVGDRQGRMEEGLRYWPLAEGLSRGQPKQEAAARNSHCAVLFAQGKYAKAEAQYRDALSLREKTLGPDHPEVAVSRNNLAVVLETQGKYAEAETQYRAALSLKEGTLGPDHPDVATSRNNLAGMLFTQGKHAEAETEQRAALSLREKALGPDHPQVAAGRDNLGIVLRAQGKHGEAEAEHRAALSLLEKALGPDHPQVAMSRSNLAGVLVELGRTAEALPLAEQAWVRHQRDDVPTGRRAETAFQLAQILWRIELGPARDRSRARQLSEDALRSYRDAGEPHEEDVREVQQWLDAHRLR